ncbi:MAG: ferredoxin [Bacteroidia bacterium]
MVRIILYRQKCIGCNACSEMAPARWRISRKDGKSNLIGGREKNGFFSLLTHDEDYDLDKLVELHCPVRVIRINKVLSH